jgi:sugar O-acyltransferase (sialic acid O-acetyltransferase NeuD family)
LARAPLPKAVVYGAGGHGKVVADLLMVAGAYELLGFVDDVRKPGDRVFELVVLGPGEWLRTDAAHGVEVALGIGDNAARKDLASRCPRPPLVVIHPSAVVARSARLGAGTVVMANATVNPDARVGEGVIINTGSVVEHDCVVGDYAHLSPNAALGGGAQLGAGVHLGLGAVVLPKVCVGARSRVGAGAVVNRDLSEDVVAVGVPARARR